MTYCGICGLPANEVKLHNCGGLDICSECRKPRLREDYLRYAYDLSVSEYNALFEKQGGICAICGNPPGKKALYVDHCHTTGKIRGLLCGHCNSMLGFSLDSTTTLASAIVYLGDTK